MSWLVSLLVLSALIFFHELGHYLAARLMGVCVEVFSIGFGKKLFSFHAYNTQWSISAIPLGGYVKMKGQDDSDPTKKSYDEDSYNVKTPIQKIFILLAGPVANFILAFVLYFTIALGGPNILSPVIGDIVKESPAEIAGLQTNDRVISINNIKITTWKEMAETIATSQGALNFEIQREGFLEYKILTPKITQTTNMYNEVINKKMIGIGSAGVSHKLELSPSETLSYATEQTLFASTVIFTGLQKLILGEVPAKELGGVISIVKLTSDATDAGWMSVLFFAGLISVNLGVLNLLPIPALDGGHIMFNLYELIARREASEAIVIKLTIAGWVILFSLMGLGLYNDISRLVG
ncbi:MAG: RIP metalloprotease RseP [Epsilonproteobacteria bacterium]|nr:RIP metalloprotease RseP [Campylobacterota bacterium]OIO16768.1 MAG: RIP metalloprotease RseP [Helicobacteraceae bacterium CG1_02_36_14]PIP10077.1 MAG: RIP metalloprotease RseP [Sulfurimonas sp. CG23_combo_of_CG06-09_8_20_14_all_36_33]PIS23673.1 MAG: RIP metalloprotease RseP [Sulfurimonas sp. CG08_land_8_20_14_0_20_36_33]PIU34824.1 MAG: RIP metalloprotease RseP [Sulfurimonas sp. CG07_land_8_20_14_0_80_36_56]PIV05128.1 MAG: RIP metalloprotease RseP [Sulfurimonas sp. CG03_land_8_20_14_0_80_36